MDHDGSGEIDFEEFTVMMQAVKEGKASLGWGRIQRSDRQTDREAQKRSDGGAPTILT